MKNEKIGELINYKLILKKVLKLIFPSSAKNIFFVYVVYPSRQPAVHLTPVLSTWHILWLNIASVTHPFCIRGFIKHPLCKRGFVQGPHRLHIPLRMDVRGQIGRDLSDVYTFGDDIFLYSDCSIRIYFGDGEGTVTQRVHFAL